MQVRYRACVSGVTVSAARVAKTHFGPETAFFWLLLDSEWLSAGDPWQSRIDLAIWRACRSISATGRLRKRSDSARGAGNAAWSPGERWRYLGTRIGAGPAVGRPRVYRVCPPSRRVYSDCAPGEGLWPPSEGEAVHAGGARIELTMYPIGYACDLR